MFVDINLKRLPFQLPRLFEAFGDFRPVDEMPPVCDVFGPFALVLEIIGMLPNIQREQGNNVPLR